MCLFEALLHAVQQGNGQQRGWHSAEQHTQHKHPDTDLVALVRSPISLIGLRHLQALESTYERHQHVALLTTQCQKACHQIIAVVAPFCGLHHGRELAVPGILHAHGFRKHILIHAGLDALVQFLLPSHALLQTVLDGLQMHSDGVIVHFSQRTIWRMLKCQQHLHACLGHTFVDGVGEQNALQGLVMQVAQTVSGVHQPVPADSDYHDHRKEISAEDQHVTLCQTQ